MYLLSKCNWNGTLLIHDTNCTEVFLEAAESWLSRKPSLLNKPSLQKKKKKSSKKNSFWSCHCSELASFDFVFTAVGLEITRFHLSCGKEEKMHLSILQEDFHKWWPVLVSKEIKWKAARQAHQRAFRIAVCVENVTARHVRALACFHLLWMQRKESTVKLKVYTIFFLSEFWACSRIILLRK